MKPASFPIRFVAFPAAALFLLSSSVTLAEGSDPTAARAQLQQGYALKQQGKYEEAMPHFLESVRLDRQPKGLVNLADCEERLGKLAAAQTHFVEARDLARAQGLEPLWKVAEQHLQAIETRMPKLVVKLAKDAPPDSIVLRDGVQLGRVSLNEALPIDQGKHVIVARGGGLEKQYEVTISEGDRKELVVTPLGGAPIAQSQEAPKTPLTSTSAPEASTGPATTVTKFGGSTSEATLGERPPSSAQRIAGFAALGVGAVGLAVGTVFTLKLSRQNDQIDSICPTGRVCMPDEAASYYSTVDDAKSSRLVAGVAFGVGAAAILTGGVLLLTAPKRQSASIHWQPTIGTQFVGATLAGEWH